MKSQGKAYLSGMVLLLILLYILYTYADRDNLQSNNSNYQSTSSAEETVIARFTQNPELAISSTPFYAEIIYDYIVRNLTEIPFPARGYYISPTPPSSSSVEIPIETPSYIPKCTTVISTGTLSDQSRVLSAQILQEKGIDVSIGIVSVGVEGIRDDCSIPFQAVRTRFSISVNLPDVANSSLIADRIAKIIDFLISEWDNMEFVSTNSTFVFKLSSNTPSPIITSTYEQVLDVYEKSLIGEELIDKLGGIHQ